MTKSKGWNLVTAVSVNPIVTIADLVAVTGFSRRTVRDMLIRYQVSPLPRHGFYDTLTYERQDVIGAIKSMPGSGRHRKLSSQ